MNEHPEDSIPAFALGTLDVDEALLVSMHVQQCPECSDHLASFHAVLAALPYTTPPRTPPAHIKQQLLARIGVGAHPLAPPTAALPRQRWMPALAFGALAVSMVLAVLLVNMNNRLSDGFQQNQQAISSMRSQVEQNQKTMAQIQNDHVHALQMVMQLNTQHTEDQLLAIFMAAPQTVKRSLYSSDRQLHATMYMQPNDTQVVLVVEDMPAAPAGKVYQFWLASKNQQVPAGVLQVTPGGEALLHTRAPAPLSTYDQVMVTLEDRANAQQPSSDIMLSGGLSAMRDKIAGWLVLSTRPIGWAGV